MRSMALLGAALLCVASACGSVDETPLGGPYGGTTTPTDPTSDDAGPLDDAGMPEAAPVRPALVLRAAP